MATFNVHALDVWGNADDGFEVNNAFRTETNVTIPENATDDDIALILIDANILEGGHTGDDITIEGDHDFMLCIYESETYEPLWNLARNEDQLTELKARMPYTIPTDTTEAKHESFQRRKNLDRYDIPRNDSRIR